MLPGFFSRSTVQKLEKNTLKNAILHLTEHNFKALVGYFPLILLFPTCLQSGDECVLSFNVIGVMHHYFRDFQLRCENQPLNKCLVFIEGHWEHNKVSESGKTN